MDGQCWSQSLSCFIIQLAIYRVGQELRHCIRLLNTFEVLQLVAQFDSVELIQLHN